MNEMIRFYSGVLKPIHSEQRKLLANKAAVMEIGEHTLEGVAYSDKMKHYLFKNIGNAIGIILCKNQVVRIIEGNGKYIDDFGFAIITLIKNIWMIPFVAAYLAVGIIWMIIFGILIYLSFGNEGLAWYVGVLLCSYFIMVNGWIISVPSEFVAADYIKEANFEYLKRLMAKTFKEFFIEFGSYNRIANLVGNLSVMFITLEVLLVLYLLGYRSYYTDKLISHERGVFNYWLELHGSDFVFGVIKALVVYLIIRVIFASFTRGKLTDIINNTARHDNSS